MANGDPLRVGLSQPPDNRATAATVLVHNGSAFGTQTSALWVTRRGAPIASSAIRGENFSSGPKNGQTVAGVMGMIASATDNIGVLGAAAAGQPRLLFGETGVMGVTNTFGVVGKGLSGLFEENGSIILASTGVLGQCDEGVGVHGVATSGFGVIGQRTSRAGVTGKSSSGPGAFGTSEVGAGVAGTSSSGAGVAGTSSSAVGVEGTSDNGLAGVRGRSPDRYGVFGESDRGVGIFGTAQGNAIQGRSSGPAAWSIGVSGFSDLGAGVQGDSTRGIGVAGRAPQGIAGFFEGRVVIRGSLSVTGAKSAVIRRADGSHRAVFCVESAESMLEDFGEVTLRGQSVVVKLARDFAPLIKRNHYHVFLSAYGPDRVYVRSRARDRFEIARLDRAAGKRWAPIQVGYRIVARRADLPAARLPKVTVPASLPRMASVRTSRSGRTRADADLRLLARQIPPPPRVPTPNLKQLTREAGRRPAKGKRRKTP
jgi:hypothetical protein